MNNKFNFNIKKGDSISIEYINILSEKTPIKKKVLYGLCTKIKKSKTNPIITLKMILLNETITFGFCLYSPLILKIKKIKI